MSDNQQLVEATQDIEFDYRFQPHTESTLSAKLSDNQFHFKVYVNGVEFEYSCGIGHSKHYLPSLTVDAAARIRRELCGIRLLHWSGGRIGGLTVCPDKLDVLYCLLMESDVCDYYCFEDWAACCGYDVDSRTAERIYFACIQNAIKLRKAIGGLRMAELRELFQEY